METVLRDIELIVKPPPTAQDIRSETREPLGLRSGALYLRA